MILRKGFCLMRRVTLYSIVSRINQCEIIFFEIWETVSFNEFWILNKYL